jgi:hypothetical protein
MGHPIMFGDDDPVLARVRHLALGFPGSAEKVSHGRPAFFTTRVFAWYGGSVKVDGVWVEHHRSLLVLPDADERAALVADSRTYVPGYLGSHGWMGVDLAADGADWPQVRELVDASYRNTAAKRLVAELDAR